MTIKVVTVGSETRVNVTTTSDQMYPAISALADGGWVETWQSLTQDGGGFGVYQRRYDALGVAVGGETPVNLVTADHQSSPSVTGLVNGGWVVTWQANLQDGSGYGIYQRVYNAQGVTTGPDMLVNPTTANEQQNPSVTALSDGGWVVTWQSNLQDGSGYGVYQRYYTSSGATVGPDILVNTSTGSDQQNPSVTALPNGGWIVSWMSHLQDGAGWGVYHRHYTANSDQILTGNPEIATGTAADETLVVQPGSLNAGDQLMGGAGTDTLQMLSSGAIDLTAPVILSGFEAVVGSGGNDTIIVSASRFGAFTTFDGGAGADVLQFLGSGTYDTRGKTFAGIEKIVLSGGGAAVTVDTVAIALLLRGSVEDHNSVTFAGGTFSAVERQQLFRQGIETIIDSSGTYTSQPPSLHGLNGDSATVADGDTVLIDRGGDAMVVDPMGSLRFLEVRVSQNGDFSEDRFGIGTEHGVSLSGDVKPGSLVSVNGIIIGTITSSGYELQVAFNGNATGALVQQLVRSLTYTNINEVDPAGAPRSISVTLTDSTGNWTTATTVVTVERTNDAPTIRGVVEAAQSVADDALIVPFSGATVADVDSQRLTVTVTLDDPAKGALLNPAGGGSYDAENGIYMLAGSAAEITTALQALQFDPRDRPTALGQDEITTFTVSVSDDAGMVVTQDVSVRTMVSNRAPTAITLSGTSIHEHATDGAMIGTFGAVDPNGDQGFTYTLLDDAGGRFTIREGELVVADASLLEATQPKAYRIQVKVTDAGGASHTYTFDITVDAQNDAPTLTGISPEAQMVEGTQTLSPFSGVTIADVDSPVLTVTVTLDNPAKGTLLGLSGGAYDPQAGTYTLTGSATQLATALQNLRFDPRDRAAPAGSVETTTFTIHVSDRGGQDVSQTVVVDAITSNRAPTAITLSGVTIDEHAGKGAVIGSLGALDANGSAGLNYTLLNDAGGRFALVEGNLVVADPKLLEAAATTQHQIWLQVTDPAGASHTQSFFITVNAQNDAPMLMKVPETPQAVEDTQILSPFSSMTVTDKDSPVLTVKVTLDDPAKGVLLNLSGGSYNAQTGTYTLTDSAAEITSALRALRFDPQDRPMALGQTETTTFTIRVQDGSDSDVSETCTVISAVSNRAPTAITLSGTSIHEHALKGALIGMLGADDPKGEQRFTYRLLDNADGRFSITDGKLVVLHPQLLAADRIETYSIQVMVTDAGGASHVQDFAITVNINHAPVAAFQGNSASGDEDTTISGKVPAGTDTDGDMLTYHLVAAVAGLSFAPDGSFSYTPAANLHGEITFQYHVVDSHNMASEAQTFTLIILDATSPKDSVIRVAGEERGLNAVEATSSVAVAITPDEGAHVVSARINGTDLDLKDGIYSFDATKLQDGSHTITVATADAAGNPTTTTKNVTIDTMAPAAPRVTLAADTGVAGDLITSNGVLTLSGVESGASVMYSTDGGKAWSSSFMATEGQNQVQVHQVDWAGNMSSIVAFDFTLDTTAPSNISLSATRVLENAAAGTIVGMLSATDADASGFTYSLAPNGDADGRFMLVTLNGTTSLVVKDGVRLDYEQARSPMVTAWVTDAAGNSFARSFTIEVGDVRTENVVGSATSDVLKGGSSSDTLSGGSGNDVLWGQTGKDVFVFDTTLGTSSSDRKVNFDTIKDFRVKDDSLWLDNAIFKKLGSGSPSKPKLLKKDFVKIGKATDKNDYVLYDKKKGVLSYDADGSGRGKAVEIAQLSKKLAMTYKDFYVI